MLSSVKARFILIVLVSLLAMSVLLISLKFSMDKLTFLTKIDKKVEVMHTQFLQLRRNEKNFFIRRDMQYHTKFNNNLQLFLENANSLKEEIKPLGFTGKRLRKILKSLKVYQEAFNNISKAYVTRGLTYTLGLQGSLREDAYQLEECLKDNPNAHILFLQMRRSEKDFFARKDVEYSEEQRFYYKKLKALLKKKESKTLLENYEKSFEASYDLRMKIGINNSEGYVYQMQVSSQNIEASIKAGSSFIVSILRKEQAQLRENTYLIFIITTVILLLLITSSAQNLPVPLTSMSLFLKRQNHLILI